MVFRGFTKHPGLNFDYHTNLLRSLSACKSTMTPKSLGITLTCFAILLIGYLLQQPEPPITAVQKRATGKRSELKKAVNSEKQAPEIEHAAVKPPRPPLRPPIQPQNTKELRDPFQPNRYRSLNQNTSTLPALERLELSELRLVAIIKDIEGVSAASVENSSGLGFMIREGTKIGPRGGYVKHIGRDLVTVLEPVSPQDPLSTEIKEHQLALRTVAVSPLP